MSRVAAIRVAVSAKLAAAGGLGRGVGQPGGEVFGVAVAYLAEGEAFPGAEVRFAQAVFDRHVEAEAGCYGCGGFSGAGEGEAMMCWIVPRDANAVAARSAWSRPTFERAGLVPPLPEKRFWG